MTPPQATTPQAVEQLWIKARGLQAKGKLNAAWKLMRDARKAAPNTAGLVLEMGVLEAQMGRLDHAQKTLLEAVKLAPSSADASFNLAEVYRARGELATAEPHYRKTLQVQPAYAEAELGLGFCLQATGNAAQALPHFQRAAAALPADTEAQIAFATALLETEEPGQGLTKLATLSASHPSDLTIALAFLQGLNTHGRPNQVARHIETMAGNFDLEAVIARFDSPGANDVAHLSLLADAFQAAAMPELAEDIARRFLRRRETRGRGALLQGTLAVQAGDFDSAKSLLEQALEEDPNSAPAMQQLAIINALPLEAKDRLYAILNDAQGNSDGNRIVAGAALYRLLSRNKQFADGFAALEQAKTIRAEALPYSEETVEQLFDTNRQVFTPAFFEQHKSDGFEGTGCVFIVGMMRSGTTLTEQILAAHSKVHAGGERNDMMSIVETLNHDLKRVPDLPQDWARKVGEQLHTEMFKGAGDATFATDKLPGNLDYVGLIRHLLPNAKFVYTHRTAQDCALSNFEQLFSDAVRFSFSLEALAHKYAWHEATARYWIDTCKLDVHDLDYEKLVHDPEPNIRALLNFAGLEFEEDCLYPNEVKREIRTASVFQVRQPISAKSVGRWKRYEQQMQGFTDSLARHRAAVKAKT